MIILLLNNETMEHTHKKNYKNYVKMKKIVD